MAQFIGVKEFATRVDAHPATILRHIKAGLLKSQKNADGKHKIALGQVRRFKKVSVGMPKLTDAPVPARKAAKKAVAAKKRG